MGKLEITACASGDQQVSVCRKVKLQYVEIPTVILVAVLEVTDGPCHWKAAYFNEVVMEE